MKKIWLHRAHSFEEAEIFEKTYYSRMTPEERLDIVQYLRESYCKMNKGAVHAHRAGLRRVVRIIQYE